MAHSSPIHGKGPAHQPKLESLTPQQRVAQNTYLARTPAQIADHGIDLGDKDAKPNGPIFQLQDKAAQLLRQSRPGTDADKFGKMGTGMQATVNLALQKLGIKPPADGHITPAMIDSIMKAPSKEGWSPANKASTSAAPAPTFDPGASANASLVGRMDQLAYAIRNNHASPADLKEAHGLLAAANKQLMGLSGLQHQAVLEKSQALAQALDAAPT
jgi:hypothetical protein